MIEIRSTLVISILMTSDPGAFADEEIGGICEYDPIAVERRVSEFKISKSFGGSPSSLSNIFANIPTRASFGVFYVGSLKDASIYEVNCSGERCERDRFVKVLNECNAISSGDCRVVAMVDDTCLMQIHYPSLPDADNGLGN
jgi:hypothetical protein